MRFEKEGERKKKFGERNLCADLSLSLIRVRLFEKRARKGV
jgi:hypothetical protein